MPKLPICCTWLVAMLVLQLARMSTAAPISNGTTTDPQPTTASSISSTVTTITSSPSTISSSALFSTSTAASTSTSSEATSSSSTSSTTTAESTWPDYEAVTSTEAAIRTEWPPYSEEIRQWPGYWIKSETDHVEAQESLVDYRTETYHIADLFAPRKQPK